MIRGIHLDGLRVVDDRHGDVPLLAINLSPANTALEVWSTLTEGVEVGGGRVGGEGGEFHWIPFFTVTKINNNHISPKA